MYLQHWLLTVRMMCLLFRSVAMSNYQNLDHSEDLIFIELEVTRSLFYQNEWMWIFAKLIIFFSPLGTKQCKINNILLIPGHKAVGEASNKFFSYVFLFKLFCMPLTYHANARNHSLGIKLQISGHVPVIHACWPDKMK